MGLLEMKIKVTLVNGDSVTIINPSQEQIEDMKSVACSKNPFCTFQINHAMGCTMGATEPIASITVTGEQT
jgi:hypothetical protein